MCGLGTQACGVYVVCTYKVVNPLVGVSFTFTGLLVSCVVDIEGVLTCIARTLLMQGCLWWQCVFKVLASCASLIPPMHTSRSHDL